MPSTLLHNHDTAQAEKHIAVIEHPVKKFVRSGVIYEINCARCLCWTDCPTFTYPLLGTSEEDSAGQETHGQMWVQLHHGECQHPCIVITGGTTPENPRGSLHWGTEPNHEHAGGLQKSIAYHQMVLAVVSNSDRKTLLHGQTCIKWTFIIINIIIYSHFR